MRGIHLSDLHLGKRLKEFPLIEEQRDALQQVLDYCEVHKDAGAAVDFIIIAGDVFDKGVPPVEALQLFDSFLYNLEQLQVEVFALGGNHDSSDRLAFLSNFLKSHRIHLVTQYEGNIEPISLIKGDEKVNFYMLPFVKPADVRRWLPEEEKASVGSYHDAVKTALARVKLEPGAANILVAHQFVTGSERCDSEEVAVGGLDNVSADAIEGFDYVALGHIHSPQNIKEHTNMRYSGTPLKYSFSECKQEKSMTILEIADSRVTVKTEPFKIMRDLFMLKGTFAELTASDMVTQFGKHYVHVTLTDEDEIPNVLSDMRKLYPYLCYLTFDNSRTKPYEQVAVDVEQSPLELISYFFAKRSGHELSDMQKSFIEELLEKVQVEK